MPDLTVLEGGGEGRPPAETCGFCGCAHHDDCRILGTYMKWLGSRGRRPNTIYNRGKMIGRLAGALDVPVMEATAADLTAWREGLTVSHASVIAYAQHLAAVYKWLVTEGFRPDNPMLRVPLPPPVRYQPRPIAERDLMRALELAPARVRPWLVLGAWTGLRACEVAGLLRSSVHDRDPAPYLHVTRQATKGSRTERTIPLTEFVIGELAPWLEDVPPGDYVFPRMDGTAGPNRAWIVSKLCNEVLRAAGIDAKYHACRHRFATEAWKASGDLLAVQNLLGHQNVGTTQRYVLFDSAAARRAVNALPVPPKLRVVREGDSA